MRSLHDVHEMDAYTAGHVCLSARFNRWTNLYEIRYGRYAIDDNRQYQHGGPTNLRGGIDTSGTCNRAIQ
jgi:hypothetical protein